jgi:aspartate/methionine/tyrosine aminotransferase
MQYKRMSIEVESPEEMGYGNIQYNLAESSVRDLALSDLGFNATDLLLSYGEHRGDSRLRTLILAEQAVAPIADTPMPPLSIDDVLTTTGAAMSLFMVATSLLEKEDHLIVIRPNYATNLETPRAIGCEVTIVDLLFENQYALDIDSIKAAIQTNTRLISLTTPHNPTGRIFPMSQIIALAQAVEPLGIRVLVDETYRNLVLFESSSLPFHRNPLAQYAAYFAPNILSVCSLSKAFGVPGIRLGWVICRDKTLMQTLLAAKEQICIGGSILDEAVAAIVLENKTRIVSDLMKRAKENWAITESHFTQMPYLEYNKPDAGVVCFPRIKPEVLLEKTFDFEGFKTALFRDYHTVVGFGHWFEQPANYFRIGFGYPLASEMAEGLRRFQACLEKFLI